MKMKRNDENEKDMYTLQKVMGLGLCSHCDCASSCSIQPGDETYALSALRRTPAFPLLAAESYFPVRITAIISRAATL